MPVPTPCAFLDSAPPHVLRVRRLLVQTPLQAVTGWVIVCVGIRQQQESVHGVVSAELVHSVVLLQAVMRLFLVARQVFGLQPATRRAIARLAPHDLPTEVVVANFLEPLPLQHVLQAVRPHLAKICLVG
jgi:hypothetical protein